jgi:hypothetical protein
MALRGSHALALWNDMLEPARPLFHAWHGHEHLPQRLAAGDILGARRFSAVSQGSGYFTLYDVENACALAPGKSNSLPSSLEQDVEPAFLPGPRLPCEVLGSFGAAQGGLLAAWNGLIDSASWAVDRQRLLAETLPEIARQHGTASCHLLQSLSTEKQIILLVESWDDLEAFQSACKVLSREAPWGCAQLVALPSLYRLQAAFTV